MRRDMGLNVTDRIEATLETSDKVRACLEKHYAFISHETLLTQVEYGPNEGAVWDLNGETARLALKKRGG